MQNTAAFWKQEINHALNNQLESNQIDFKKTLSNNPVTLTFASDLSD